MTAVLPPPPSTSANGAGQHQIRTRVVLDTSVLVADPNAAATYPGCDVVVPFTVVEELDGLKARPDDVGRSARAALRGLEELRLSAGGSLAHPVPISAEPDATTVHIEINNIQRHVLTEHGLDPAIPDNRIIGAALGQATTHPTQIVSNDAALRIKAAHLGLVAMDHRPVGRSGPTRPSGWSSFDVGRD